MTRGRPPIADLLTPAEWRVAHLVRHGLSNRRIAEQRGVSRDAIKQHVASIVAKLGLADRQALRRWREASRNRFEAPEGSSMTDDMGIGRIGQVARSVSDVAAAEAWYRDVLGLRHLFSFPGLAFFDCGGTRLMLSSENGAKPESILYFHVDDLPAAYDRIVGRGAVSESPPHRIHRHPDGTEEWMAFVRDNDGRPIGLMAQVNPSPESPRS